MAFHCHCRDCQYATGSAFATVVGIPLPAFNKLNGEVKSYTVTAESGEGTVSREFCIKCGSPLFSYASMLPDIVFVKAGSLDDASWLKPGAAIWTRSQQPWMAEIHSVPDFPENPPL
jgi:hypothetical protein